MGAARTAGYDRRPSKLEATPRRRADLLARVPGALPPPLPAHHHNKQAHRVRPCDRTARVSLDLLRMLEWLMGARLFARSDDWSSRGREARQGEAGR